MVMEPVFLRKVGQFDGHPCINQDGLTSHVMCYISMVSIALSQYLRLHEASTFGGPQKFGCISDFVSNMFYV